MAAMAIAPGGSAWIDVLDMDSMDRSDMLLERLVDHEAALPRWVAWDVEKETGESLETWSKSIYIIGLLDQFTHLPRKSRDFTRRNGDLVDGYLEHSRTSDQWWFWLVVP